MGYLWTLKTILKEWRITGKLSEKKTHFLRSRYLFEYLGEEDFKDAQRALTWTTK